MHYAENLQSCSLHHLSLEIKGLHLEVVDFPLLLCQLVLQCLNVRSRLLFGIQGFDHLHRDKPPELTWYCSDINRFMIFKMACLVDYLCSSCWPRAHMWSGPQSKLTSFSLLSLSIFFPLLNPLPLTELIIKTVPLESEGKKKKTPPCNFI